MGDSSKMKLSIFAFLLSFSCFSLDVFAKEIEVTIYCDDAYTPYSYEEKNQPQGIYTKIIREAGKKLKGYKLKIIPMPWNRAMLAIEKKQVFAVYPPYLRTKERPFIGSYSVPILEETIVVYTRKELLNESRSRWPEDWYGKKIGIFLGTIDIAGTKFTNAVAENKIKMIEEKGHEINLLHLGNGKIDAYVNDRNSILYAISELKKKHKWQQASELVEAAVVSKEWGYLAFSKDDPKYPFKEDFIKKFNSAITQLQEEHKIEKIVKNALN
jgi:polar amino acid transport system substrate-binding protein